MPHTILLLTPTSYPFIVLYRFINAQFPPKNGENAIFTIADTEWNQIP